MSQTMRSRFVTTVTHWGAYNLEVVNDRVVAVHNLGDDGDPSAIGQSLAGTLDDACRIRAPAVRKGYLESGFQSDGQGRGVEPFVEVTWDDAQELVAAELQRVRREFGNNAIFGGSYGWASAGRFHHAQSQLHRFLNCIGGYTSSVDTYSFAAAEVIVPHVLGDFWSYISSQTSWPAIIGNTRLLVSFGGLPVKNTQISNGGTGRHVQQDYMQAAHESGIEFVNISPIRDDCADYLNAEWLALRPNTDVALMLGIAHTLVQEGLHDQAFLERYCTGFARFLDYLNGAVDGQVKDAAWATAITDIDASVITRLARRMASKRCMISLSWSLTRQDHGEQPYWMGITLAAMLGQMGLPGGGIGFGYAAENTMGNNTSRYRLGALPRSSNSVEDFIPVARIADMLLNPGAEFDYNGKRYNYPDIKLVYWAGGNPFHQQQETGKLLRAWQQPQTIVVNEIWWNATAKHADIVLPCTSPLERNDIGGASIDPCLIAMHAAVSPCAQARNDFDIFLGIAEKMGLADTFTGSRDEMQWLRYIYESTANQNPQLSLPDFDIFWNDNPVIHFPQPDQPRVILDDFRENPEKNPLSTPGGKIEIFSETIAAFAYADCPGHPVWLEPVEWQGCSLSKQFPLHLISNQPATRLHSQLDNGITSRHSKIREREPVRMHPEDAAARGISDGGLVRIFNSRGQCLAGVILERDLRPGVIQMSTGAWWDPLQPGSPDSLCRHGQVNVLTLDKGTSSLAQGPSALSCLVEVEACNDDPPAVSAFDPPDFCKMASA